MEAGNAFFPERAFVLRHRRRREALTTATSRVTENGKKMDDVTSSHGARAGSARCC